MIHIRKNPEPKLLTQHRCTPNSTYENLPTETKQAVLESLCAEQHNLCAYCTCRITAGAVNSKGEKASIEHFYPRHPELPHEVKKDWDTRYSNLLAVCPGTHANERTCDEKKANKVISADPTLPHIIAQLHYKNDGTLYSTDTTLNNELNNILNLNSTRRSLPQARRKVMLKVKKRVTKREQKFSHECMKLLTELEQRPEPYCGMALEWLRSKVGRNS